jgi:hypothetical protein
MNERQIPYELLAKYLSRQCIQAELEEVNRWLNEDAEHPLLLEKLKLQWEAVQVDASAFVIPDKAAVWNKVQARIRDKVKQVPLYSRSLLIRVSSIAAVIALVLGFSLSFLLVRKNPGRLLSSKMWLWHLPDRKLSLFFLMVRWSG